MGTALSVNVGMKSRRVGWAEAEVSGVVRAPGLFGNQTKINTLYLQCSRGGHSDSPSTVQPSWCTCALAQRAQKTCCMLVLLCSEELKRGQLWFSPSHEPGVGHCRHLIEEG